MKHLLPLSCDFIIRSRFIANQKEDSADTDWIDEKKELANGKLIVDSIHFFQPVQDPQGYNTIGFTQVWLNSKDILKLAKEIAEIEAKQVVGTYDDDIPF